MHCRKWRQHTLRWLLAGTVLPLLVTGAGPLQAQVTLEDTADLYARWRDRTVQVQVLDRQSRSRSALGSGYFAGQPGWIVTNYHVVADLANQPERHEARYLSESGREGRLELLSVDVVHDLAVLRAEGMKPTPLELAREAPRKGARAYSMGYPYDIGLTIVEGTYSGMMERSLYDRLHFTGSINPGMSGGPALNRAGEVVGTNVATAGNQVGFLVPSVFVRNLLEKTSEPRAATRSLDETIAGQLTANQSALAERLLNGPMPVTSLDGFDVPGALADWLNCWGSRQEDVPDDLDQIYYRCESQDDIFLSTTLSTGIIRYQHELLSSDDLHPLRFYKQLEDRGYYPRLTLDGDESTVTNYRCRSDFVDAPETALQVTFCVRTYLSYPGLYDAYLSSTSLVENRRALQSTLLLAGFDWDHLNALSRRFVSALSWVGDRP
ncbi:S1C family serine protease [Elongatibacter sediminis]|uniref:Serine protease n=1 Tax=Elongatibacter sediminis TaxID=3119006 RepID=A0AAW9RI49_9GAMM